MSSNPIRRQENRKEKLKSEEVIPNPSTLLKIEN